MLTTLHRFNRIIFNLIHFNNNINNQTKMELYKDLHNYTNEIVQHQNNIESRLNKLEAVVCLSEQQVKHVEPQQSTLFVNVKSQFYQNRS